jgi:DNA-3-methyladenine glycosylase II
MTPIYRKARKHLSQDAVLAALIEQHGKCTLTPEPEEPFTMLVRCVVGQQISTKAARSIYAQLMANVKVMNPKRLAAASEDDIRSAGISGPKQKALRAIVEHVQTNRNFLKTLPTLDDDAFREEVTQIKGIGPWSADMMLMFGYGRLDVMPVGDYGVRVAAMNLYGLDELPKPAKLYEISEPWRPYRSIGAWYLWRSLEKKE